MCFRKIAATKSDFAIMGGDHVFDAFGVDATRARMVFDMYGRAEKLIGMPLHNAIGNHDVFVVLTKSGVAPTDPAYGKKCIRTAWATPSTRSITRDITSSCSIRSNQ